MTVTVYKQFSSTYRPKLYIRIYRYDMRLYIRLLQRVRLSS